MRVTQSSLPRRRVTQRVSQAPRSLSHLRRPARSPSTRHAARCSSNARWGCGMCGFCTTPRATRLTSFPISRLQRTYYGSASLDRSGRRRWSWSHSTRPCCETVAPHRAMPFGTLFILHKCLRLRHGHRLLRRRCQAIVSTTAQMSLCSSCDCWALLRLHAPPLTLSCRVRQGRQRVRARLPHPLPRRRRAWRWAAPSTTTRTGQRHTRRSGCYRQRA